MSILNYKKYLEELQNESYDYETDVDEIDTEDSNKTGIDFQDSRALLDWMDGLKNSPNLEVKKKVTTMNPSLFRALQRQLIKLFDDGEIDTIEDAEDIILQDKLNVVNPVFESKRVLHPTEYDVYLKNKEYMVYFNKVKDMILELFPMHNISNIDLLIDKIYTCYVEKYSIEDTVNNLYMSGNLYTFTAKGNDI